MGQYLDKDGDGFVTFYPDPKKPNEVSPNTVDKSVIDADDSNAAINPNNASTPSSSNMQYASGVYPIYTPGKPIEYVDRTGLKKWLNNNLDVATVKRYQQILKDRGLLPKSYAVNGKMDLKGQFAGAIGKVIQNQVERGVDAETLADGISYVQENYAPSATASTTGTVSAQAAQVADINATFQNIFGEDAPKTIQDAYSKELTALQASRGGKTKKVNGKEVAVSTTVYQQEAQNLLDKYTTNWASSKIKAADAGDPAALASLNKGNFGITYTTLKNAYANNGIPYNPISLAEQAKQGVLSKDKLNAELNLINLQAKTYFPALADKIDKGYSVKQLLSPYIQTRANILEEDPDTIDIKTLQGVAKDPNQLVNLYDYEVSLRSDPKWRYTKNAHNTLSNVARGIAETFGLMG